MLIEDGKLAVNKENIELDKSEDSFVRQMREFVDAIQNEREPITAGRKILPTMAILDAVKKSNEEQGIISLKPLFS